MSDETKLINFDSEEWERYERYYFKHEDTGNVIHEETYYGKCNELNAIAEYERQKNNE